MAATSNNQGVGSGSIPIAIPEVPGLIVCPEFFSLSIEKELYNSDFLFQHGTPNNLPHGQRHGTPNPAFQDASSIPLALVKVCNGITESGLCPNFIAPNYCFAISYPEKAQFFYHYDSRYRWGETITAITLGVAGVMSFQPQTKTAKGNGPPFVGRRTLDAKSGLGYEIRTTKNSWVVDVFLPPRSVYIMSGSSRYDWKHMVKHNTDANRRRPLGSGATTTTTTTSIFPPSNVRRTITLRCTKAYSDEVLQRQLRASTPNDDTTLKARIKSQSKYRPQVGYHEGKLTNPQLEEERYRASLEVTQVCINFASNGGGGSNFRNVFLADNERGYRIVASKKSCWPLLDGGLGRKAATEPSSLVPKKFLQNGSSALLNPGGTSNLLGGFGGSGSSGMVMNVPLSLQQILGQNVAVAAAAATADATNHQHDNNNKQANSTNGDDDEDDDDGEDSDLARAIALSLKEVDDSKPPAVHAPAAVVASGSTNTTKTSSKPSKSSSSASLPLSKEDLRAKRLAALMGNSTSGGGNNHHKNDTSSASAAETEVFPPPGEEEPAKKKIKKDHPIVINLLDD